MILKFEVTESGEDAFAFKLRADNGLVILTSRAHAAKAEVLLDIESVRRDALIDARYERLASPQGQPYFNLRSASGQVIGQSQRYSSQSAMESGIASVARHGPGAVLIDMAPERKRVIAR